MSLEPAMQRIQAAANHAHLSSEPCAPKWLYLPGSQRCAVFTGRLKLGSRPVIAMTSNPTCHHAGEHVAATHRSSTKLGMPELRVYPTDSLREGKPAGQGLWRLPLVFGLLQQLEEPCDDSADKGDTLSDLLEIFFVLFFHGSPWSSETAFFIVADRSH
jgi:hypothetical protein